MDKPGHRYLWLLLGLLAVGASADCTSYGVDYSSGGSYSIDRSSNQYFSFITVFQGKQAKKRGPTSVGLLRGRGRSADDARRMLSGDDQPCPRRAG